jgi:putative ABC transport system permease protein
MMHRVVGGLLYLFPKEFRRSFEADMLATFDDRWRARASFSLAVRIIFDLIANAFLERLSTPVPAAQPVRTGDSQMAILWQDFFFALRTLRKSPSFTLIALITLALGIGVDTAMFSIANAILWQSLPFPEPNRIVWVGEVQRTTPDNAWGATYLNFRDWQTRSHSFEMLAGILQDDRILRQGSEPSRVSGFAATRELFEVLGVQPSAGRVFGASDENPGAQPVIVLSDRMWRRRFGSDPAILGRTIHFDDLAATVIGIMPRGFETYEAEYWIPLDPVIPTYFKTHRAVWVMTAIARLKPGQTTATAQREVEGIMQQIRQDHPEVKRDFEVRVNPLKSHLSRDLRPALLALLGAVAVVLLIACANLAGLMSVRAAARGREMAIRSALGAGRHRMIRQLLTESAALALAGGFAGVGLAFWALRGLQWLSKDPRLLKVTIDSTVLLFAFCATLVTSLLFGVAPAIRAARTHAADALKSGPRIGGGRSHALSRQMLVVTQVALCLVLLVGAGLMFRSFRRLLDVDPGFRADHLAALRVELPNSYKTIAAVMQIDQRFLERLRSMPGVADATMINALPVSGNESNGDISIEGMVSAPGELGATSFRRTVPGYFHAMGIPLIRGREFSDSDDRQHEQVAIINETMARRFWPSQDPIGHRFQIGPRDTAQWMTIIGVSKDVRNRGLDSDAGFSTYQPFAQQPRTQMEFAIRTTGDPGIAMASARRELWRIEPAATIDNVQTMSQRIGETLSPRRLNLALFALFSTLALVLAAIGLYGVVAYAAGQRTREFGIRMALGARSGDVLWLVLGQGLKLALIGAAIGLVAAIGLGRLLTKLLFGVEPTDPVTMIAVAVLLGCVAMIACWLPARRATRIAPTEALRSE